MSYDAWLNDEEPKKRTQFLSSWKERGYIDIWLHTKVSPVEVWRHSFPKLITRDGQASLSNRPWNCHESKEILRAQYFRDRHTGARQHPPKSCVFCMMVEWVREQLAHEMIDWLTPIFIFPNANNGRDLIYHAQGIVDGYRDVTQEGKQRMRDAGVYQKDGWRENLNARKQYVFCLVDHENVDRGVQIASEASSLGDKTRIVMKDVVMKYGAEEGSYDKNPYCLRWKFTEDADINNKYHVLDMPKVKITNEISELIHGDAPNIDSQIKPYDKDELRSLFERYLQVDAPLDAWFGTAANRVQVSETLTKSVLEPEVPSVLTSEPVVTKPSRSRKPKVETVACDECQKPMLVTDTTCPHCGAEYETVDDNIPF
jgi:hypothetical protein